MSKIQNAANPQEFKLYHQLCDLEKKENKLMRRWLLWLFILMAKSANGRPTILTNSKNSISQCRRFGRLREGESRRW